MNEIAVTVDCSEYRCASVRQIFMQLGFEEDDYTTSTEHRLTFTRMATGIMPISWASELDEQLKNAGLVEQGIFTHTSAR
ncbi:hypothetical protein BH10CYA1_BH10CYA1_62210 [soil metagenome]